MNDLEALILLARNNLPNEISEIYINKIFSPKIPLIFPIWENIKQKPDGRWQIAKTFKKGQKRVVCNGKTKEVCYQSALRFIEKYQITI